LAAPSGEFVRYDASVETREPDEAETTRSLIETLRSIAEVVHEDSGHAERGVHAKSHGLLTAELEVLPGLAPELAQGLFAKPGRYAVVMRLSTIPGDILDDSVSTPRGLAIKIIGVEGARLPGSEGDATQDFVLVNGPAFAAPNAKQFLSTLKMLAKTTDKAEGLKKVASAAMRGVQRVIVATTGEPSAVVATLGGQPETNILGETFYSQAALRHGDYIAKIAVFPASPELKALTQAPVTVNGAPNGLRDAVVDFFGQNEAVWEIRAQLCADLDVMPVEDASVKWPEDKSAYRAVARLVAKPQPAWSAARSAAIDDGMSFSPWHGLAAHQPLGSIMRVRKAAYEMSARYRAGKNGATIVEPKPGATTALA
jgi:hypothetical protein